MSTIPPQATEKESQPERKPLPVRILRAIIPQWVDWKRSGRAYKYTIVGVWFAIIAFPLGLLLSPVVADWWNASKPSAQQVATSGEVQAVAKSVADLTASQRPILSIRAERALDGRYIRIVRAGMTISCSLEAKITNDGGVAAVDISNHTTDETPAKEKNRFKFEPTTRNLALAPGQSVFLNAYIKYTYTDEETLLTDLKKMVAMQDLELVANFAFRYHGVNDRTRELFSGTKMIINPYQVTILASDHR